MNRIFQSVQSLSIYIFVLILCTIPAGAQGLKSSQIDSIVQSSMERLPQAGLAIAVVKDGKLIHSKGYGLASLETGKKVNENTLFEIASNSKAFTVAAMAILVDEGKLSWQDKVIDYIPEFKMYAPYITENFTIEDLLTHRSGLGLGAGDLMIFPDGGNFTIQDVLQSFQYQKQVSQFRTKWDYDNLLYIVAGEVIARISGQSWEDFVKTRIMDPLDMKSSATSSRQVKDKSNIAFPHSSVGGELRQVDAYSLDLTNAAGGIYASVNDFSKWMLLQLNGGKYGKDLEHQLFSEERQNEMWQPHTLMKFSFKPDERYQNHFTAYGLGWELSDYKGHLAMHHTGGLPGMLSMTMLIPDLNLGVVVLTNSEPGGYSFITLTRAITDAYLNVEKRDWVDFAYRAIHASAANADSVKKEVWTTVEEAKSMAIDYDKYTGTFEDPWFGKVEIFRKDNELWFKSLRSPKLNGPMYYYKANTFAVKMEYTAMESNAFAMFDLDEEGQAISFKMKGISPNIDFSFDYQDLDLHRVN